jgi:antitoxin ParD1/3/4
MISVNPVADRFSVGFRLLAMIALWAKLKVLVEDQAMTAMNISLPEDMSSFIEAQMQSEGFASASEYLVRLIREEQKRKAKQALEAKFREALESGPATPMTKQDWADLRREALDGLVGETIKP